MTDDVSFDAVLEELPATTAEVSDALGADPELVGSRLGNLKQSGEVSREDDGEWVAVGDEAVPTVTTEVGEPTQSDLPSAFVTELKQNGITYDQVQRRFGWSNTKLQTVLDRMSEAGWAIDFETIDRDGTRRWYIPSNRDKRVQVGDGDGWYRFGLISDTHLGSKACHLGDLHDFYDLLAELGIEVVLHGGDISDGWKVHENQINEVHGEATGWNRLRKYVVDHYPKRDEIETIFISGNHDRKLWRREGIRFGEQLAERREDLHWLGDSMARVVFDPENNVDLELIHPSGGQPYSLGYRAQTLYREQPSDIRPSIAAIGHLHGRMYASAEGVEAFYTGCWKDLTTYGRRKGHATEIGGWIIELLIEDGRVERTRTEFVSYPTNDSNRPASQSIADLHDVVDSDPSLSFEDASLFASGQSSR